MSVLLGVLVLRAILPVVPVKDEILTYSDIHNFWYRQHVRVLVLFIYKRAPGTPYRQQTR